MVNHRTLIKSMKSLDMNNPAHVAAIPVISAMLLRGLPSNKFMSNKNCKTTALKLEMRKEATEVIRETEWRLIQSILEV